MKYILGVFILKSGMIDWKFRGNSIVFLFNYKCSYFMHKF